MKMEYVTNRALLAAYLAVEYKDKETLVAGLNQSVSGSDHSVDGSGNVSRVHSVLLSTPSSAIAYWQCGTPRRPRWIEWEGCTLTECKPFAHGSTRPGYGPVPIMGLRPTYPAQGGQVSIPRTQPRQSLPLSKSSIPEAPACPL